MRYEERWTWFSSTRRLFPFFTAGRDARSFKGAFPTACTFESTATSCFLWRACTPNVTPDTGDRGLMADKIVKLSVQAVTAWRKATFSSRSLPLNANVSVGRQMEVPHRVGYPTPRNGRL